MRFVFCGNLDCPEWVLSEVVQLNKFSAGKLRQILQQIVKKILGQPFDQEKLIKVCKEQNLNADETKVLLAVLEFVISQAGKHIVTEQQFSKDLLQIGISIDNSNAIVKIYTDSQDALHKALKNSTLKISQIDGMNYKLSYLFASSSSGYVQNSQNGQLEALDTVVTLGIDLTQYPNSLDKSKTYVKFGISKDKFLQFSRDMKEALALLEATTSLD